MFLYFADMPLPCQFEADDNTVLLMQFNDESDVNGTVHDYSNFNNTGEIRKVGELVPDFTENVCLTGLKLGQDNYINVSSHNGFNSTEVTYELWAIDQGSSTGSKFISREKWLTLKKDERDSLTANLAMYDVNNTLMGDIKFGNHPVKNITQYYAITYDGLTWRVYINSALVAIHTPINETRPPYNELSNLLIGADKFKGTVFSVRLSNIARTVGEIRWNFHRGKETTIFILKKVNLSKLIGMMRSLISCKCISYSL